MTKLVCDETGVDIGPDESFYVVTRHDGRGILALSTKKVATLPNGTLLTMGPPGPGFEGLQLRRGVHGVVYGPGSIETGEHLFTMSLPIAQVNLPTITSRLFS